MEECGCVEVMWRYRCVGCVWVCGGGVEVCGVGVEVCGCVEWVEECECVEKVWITYSHWLMQCVYYRHCE